MKKESQQEIIELTRGELDEIKEEFAFRKLVTVELKTIKSELQKINGLHTKVAVLDSHSKAHWALLTAIISGLIGLIWWIK